MSGKVTSILVLLLGVNAVLTQKNNVFENRTSLPRYNVRLVETSVSGFSSGSSFANQFHVAYSSFIKGAGLLNGGQYACVANHPRFLNCFDPFPIVFPLVASRARDQVMADAAAGRIDPPSNINNQKLIIISGRWDVIVDHKVQEKQFDSYKLMIDAASGPGDYPNLKFVQKPYGHNFLTDIPSSSINSGIGCFGSYPPFIASCNYDSAGNILKHIYGTLAPRNDDINRGGKFLIFPQTELHPEPENIGLSEEGYLYVPNICEDPAQECRLHVVFHGCLQSHDNFIMKRQFVTETGYAEWADTNRLILAFPQTTPRLFGDKDFGNNVTRPNIDLSKINACWDMFGLYDVQYYNKQGQQMKAIRQLIDRIVRIEDAL